MGVGINLECDNNGVDFFFFFFFKKEGKIVWDIFVHGVNNFDRRGGGEKRDRAFFTGLNAR